MLWVISEEIVAKERLPQRIGLPQKMAVAMFQEPPVQTQQNQNPVVANLSHNLEIPRAPMSTLVGTLLGATYLLALITNMKRRIGIPILITLSVLTVTLVFVEPTLAESTPKLITPTLQVDIPTIQFSTATLEDGVLNINYLGDYIAGIYKYLLGISTTIAIVMLMIGGLQWAFGGVSEDSIKKAKDRIKNAITGLVLLLSAYAILLIVNPNLIKLQFPELAVIKAIELPEDGEDTDINTSAAVAPGIEGSTLSSSALSSIIHSHIISNGQTVNSTVLADLYAAADEFYATQGDQMKITSGARTPQRQLEIFYEKCSPTSTSASCNPLVCLNYDYVTNGVFTRKGNGNWGIDGSIETSSKSAFVEDLIDGTKASFCPHTSTIALDIWCELGSYGDYTFDTECMKTLGEIMMKHNFCRLAAEPWHFEYNSLKVSTNCSISQDPCSYTGNSTYNFCTDTNAEGETCTKWKGKKNGECVAY